MHYLCAYIRCSGYTQNASGYDNTALIIICQCVGLCYPILMKILERGPKTYRIETLSKLFIMQWLTTNLYPRGLEKTAILILFKQNGTASVQNLKISVHCLWRSACEDLRQVWTEEIPQGASTLDTGQSDEFPLRKLISWICVYNQLWCTRQSRLLIYNLRIYFVSNTIYIRKWRSSAVRMEK